MLGALLPATNSAERGPAEERLGALLAVPVGSNSGRLGAPGQE